MDNNRAQAELQMDTNSPRAYRTPRIWTTRWHAGVLAACLLLLPALLVSPLATAQPAGLSPAQQQQWQMLSEEQRQRLLEQQSQRQSQSGDSGSEQPGYDPESIPPRDASTRRGRDPQAGGAQGTGAQGQYPPGQYPQGQYPQGQYPPGQYPPGQYPPGQYPPGQYPLGLYPPGQFPPGQYQPDQYPPGWGLIPPVLGPDGQPTTQQQADAWQQQLERIRQEDEEDILSEAEAEQQQLERFGYDVFAGDPDSFSPATNIPIPNSYVVGPGDTVIIQLFGQRNATHELVVTRDGELQFPEIGPVPVAGLTFQAMREQLQSTVQNQLIGQNANITMGPLRSINVFVMGEAWRPGSYTVSALSTITNALVVSGGITDIGSLRNVRLMRAGERVGELDLYDLLLRGDTSGDVRLRANDTIFIPPVGTAVGVTGEVRRPAIYELKGEESPADLVELAGGLEATAFPQAARLERINEQGQRILLDVNPATGEGPAPRDGDLLRVPSVLEQLENVVQLEGHAERPGGVQWRQGLRVSDVLPSVRDLRPDPDLEYALIAREIQPTRRIELLQVNLGEAINNPGSPADLALQPRDRLLTFSASRNRQSQLRGLLEQLRLQATFQDPPLIVNVRGNVRFPGLYPLVRGMTLDEAIRYAGGLDANSELDYLLVERRIDRSDTVAVLSSAIDPDTLRPQRSITLQEQDEIVVFNANQPRELLLAPTLERLRNQASAERPTRIASVTGEVRFPGDYPLEAGMTVERLIEVAGGLSEAADPRDAEITRYDAHPEVGREIGHQAVDLQATGAAGQGYTLQPFDQLVVRQMPNWTVRETVTVGGEVNSPGTYTITKDETLTSLIERAGGLTEQADADAAIFLREELRENEQELLEEFQRELERDLITRRLQLTGEGQQSSGDVEGLLGLLERIADIEATGRLVIDLPGMLAGDRRAAQVTLRPGDELLVPRQRQEITVMGEVHRPTSHVFRQGRDVSDYIASSGGMTQSGDKDGIFIIKASGEVISVGGGRWFFERRQRLEPGDSIVVPFDTYRPTALYTWRNVTQILFNLSTTLLAIERVGN